MTNGKIIKLGSLFDGIGAFPYAASFFGITPLWASEILPNSVSITKRHFPEMAHLGDITKLDGGKIPPVDIICFGSPCQSWSVAGTRTGFLGKSSLFNEAIRIIREMRCATNGKQPQIACFENVLGLLNNNGGLDYQAVISALCETEVPMPASGKWANAGMVRGGNVDFAWVCKDAQHYRTAQRRKRLLAISDFAGRRAAEILFVPKSLSGYFEARERQRQGTPAASQGGAGESVAVINDQGGRSISLGDKGLSPTLRSQTHGNLPTVCAGTGQDIVAFAQNQRDEVRDLNDKSGCLAAGQGMKQQTYVIQPDKNCLTPWDLQQSRIYTQSGISPALVGADGGGGRNPAGLVMTEVHPGIAGTICGSGAGTSRTAGNCNETDLTVVYGESSYGGYSLNYQNPVRQGYTIRRLTPTECERLMSFDDGYTAYGHDGKPMSDSARYQMLGNSIVVNVLAYIMQNIAEYLRKEL